MTPLFSPRAVDRLQAVARNLPGGVLAALEARLTPGDDAVDLSIRLQRSSDLRDLALIPMPEAVHALLGQWAQPDGALARVPSVWLEIDLPTSPAVLLVPCVCAKLPADADPFWLADTLLPALLGERPAPDLCALLLRCLAAVPPPAQPLYLFSLFPREGSPVRLEIFGLDLAGIAACLRQVAPASVERVVAAAELLTGAERLHLSFDFGAEVLPRIGVEGSFPRLPNREPRWLELFDRLVDRGLCAAEKRDAALAWPGYDSFWTAPERWPAGVGAGGFCARALSHIKLVSRPDRELEAKVYLLVERLSAKA
ncbi:MAG TPA: hypothetical protein VGK45_04745 [Thermoanaerobaculia bacterium]